MGRAMLDRYLEGTWLKYFLTFIGGMAFARFVLTPGDMDAWGMGVAAVVCIGLLLLCKINDEALAPRLAQRHARQSAEAVRLDAHDTDSARSAIERSEIGEAT